MSVNDGTPKQMSRRRARANIVRKAWEPISFQVTPNNSYSTSWESSRCKHGKYINTTKILIHLCLASIAWSCFHRTDRRIYQVAAPRHVELTNVRIPSCSAIRICCLMQVNLLCLSVKFINIIISYDRNVLSFYLSLWGNFHIKWEWIFVKTAKITWKSYSRILG